MPQHALPAFRKRLERRADQLAICNGGDLVIGGGQLVQHGWIGGVILAAALPVPVYRESAYDSAQVRCQYALRPAPLAELGEHPAERLGNDALGFFAVIGDDPGNPTSIGNVPAVQLVKRRHVTRAGLIQ